MKAWLWQRGIAVARMIPSPYNTNHLTLNVPPGDAVVSNLAASSQANATTDNRVSPFFITWTTGGGMDGEWVFSIYNF